MTMTRVTFVQPGGAEQTFEAGDGSRSLMEVARAGGVAGIAADCGGACACATCHVHVDPAWIDVVGRAVGVEADMLDLASEPTETSRLSCQITIRPDLDGLRVNIPPEAQP